MALLLGASGSIVAAATAVAGASDARISIAAGQASARLLLLCLWTAVYRAGPLRSLSQAALDGEQSTMVLSQMNEG